MTHPTDFKNSGVNRPKTHWPVLLLACLGLFTIPLTTANAQSQAQAQQKPAADRPVRALLITGGGFHNYPFQAQALTNAIGRKAPVIWTIMNEGGGGTRAEIALYNDPDWAKAYDIIIHNECFADTDNPEYVRKITAAHRAGKPAVVIHCAMHTYRAAKFDDWREFLGVTSRYHEEQGHYPVKPVATTHPIMKGFPTNWVTPMDELYVIEKLWPGSQALATCYDAKLKQDEPVAWVHEYHGTRVFGTTFGHSDDTFRDPVFLDLLANGFFWAAGRLN